MATINVVNSDGQTVSKNTEDVTVAEIQNLVMLNELPQGTFDHVIRLPAANGAVKTGALSHTALIADAVAAVDTARTQIVTMVTNDINALKAADITLQNNINAKMNAPAGTASQVVLGNGTLGALPAGVDISGKSDKANFTALSVQAAHGIANPATNAPTNAPVDSKTDYNAVTTLLGGVVDGLNTTNTKQNQIATNLNAVATNLNALANLVITMLAYMTTTRNSYNNLRTAGAT